MSNKWYIGQEVVCINDSNTEGLIKNKVYNIKGFYNCCNLLIDVGITEYEDMPRVMCKCGRVRKHDGQHYYLESRFKPLDELYNKEIKEIEEFINQPELV